MIEKVRTYIEREIGLEPQSNILVALSGGADSVALTLILKELGYNVHALHCTFHLRAEESNRDEAFVEAFCQKHQISLSVCHFQTETEARNQGVSIEMAARNLRYEWFRKEKNNRNADCIAVAHHRDDQAETLLLNILRGTGLRGLAGMHPCNNDIIRPLLCLSRNEILSYLKECNQDYVTDSTNLMSIAQRNHIRLNIIPLLQSLNPAAVEHLCTAAENVRQSLPYYFKGVDVAANEIGISKDSFPLSALSSRVLLHEWIEGKGFNAAQEDEISQSAQKAVGKLWQSQSHCVVRNREALQLYPLENTRPVPQLHQEIVPSIQERTADVAYFDADLLNAPIQVRPVREGDVFVPFGMKGRKLISDYLTDCKVDRWLKKKQYVATCGDDIIWLIGHRSDNRFRVTDSTARILKLSLIMT